MQSAFHEFVETIEGRAWIQSSAFDRACIDLFARLERGEIISMQKAADMVGMPLACFAETFVEYLRAEAAYRRDLADAAVAVLH